MSIKTIPLSFLETNSGQTLRECADSGDPIVVQLPDNRLLAIQPLDCQDDDDLVNNLLEHDERFRALVERSKAAPRKPFSLS